jgi:SIR2-like domain
MIALLAGAGFSKWAAGLPLAKELFDFNVVPFGVREARWLEKVRGLKHSWTSEHPGEHEEAFIAYASEHNIECRRLVLWYIVRRLSDPYVWTEWHAGKERRHVLMIDELRKLDCPGVTRARDFLMGVLGFALGGVITTNYDLLIEYALGSRRFNYGSPDEVLQGRGPYPVSQWKHPVTLTGGIRLAKVHGSISWDENGRYTDGRRGLTGNALIVAPVPHKTAPSALRGQWDLAGNILDSSADLVVFGFAFNAYDSKFLRLLEVRGRGVKRVLLIDIAPNVGAARALWSGAVIDSIPPPPKGQDGLFRWAGHHAAL